MPTISLRKAVYDELVRQGEDPTEFIHEAAKDRLKEEHGVEVNA